MRGVRMAVHEHRAAFGNAFFAGQIKWRAGKHGLHFAGSGATPH
jgi:hypothetical protein